MHQREQPCARPQLIAQSTALPVPAHAKLLATPHIAVELTIAEEEKKQKIASMLLGVRKTNTRLRRNMRVVAVRVFVDGVNVLTDRWSVGTGFLFKRFPNLSPRADFCEKWLLFHFALACQILVSKANSFVLGVEQLG